MHNLSYRGILVVFIATLGFLFVSCFEQPVSPYKPSNTKLYMDIKSSTLYKNVDQYTDTVDNSISIGLTSNFPYYIDSISVKIVSFDGSVDNGKILKNIDTAKNINDTIWYSTHFASAGIKSIIARAFIQENNKDSVVIGIKIYDKLAPPNPVIAPRVKPHLAIAGFTRISTAQTCSLSVSAWDTNAAQQHTFYVKQDTFPQTVFAAPTFKWLPPAGFTGTSTVFFKVADTDSPSYFDTATVVIIVSATLSAPAQPKNIAPVMNGTVFSMTWGNSLTDDYIIFRSGAATGPFTALDTVTGLGFADTIGTLNYYYYVKAHNSVDTSVASAVVYTGDFRSTSPHWTSKILELSGAEGTKLSMLLTDKCTGDSLSFSIANIPVLNNDTIINAVYSYTFAINDTNNYYPKIILKDKKGAADTMTLHLWATKTDRDSIAPIIKYLTPSRDSINVNSKSYNVSVICKDNSGIASVKCSMGIDTFATSRSSDSIWSATVTGLVQGQVKIVTLIATDMSARANKDTVNFYIKYDSTSADVAGPTFTKVSGPASNTTITSPVVTLTYTIVDPSGVDSVYWTLNGAKAGTIVANASGQYVLIDTLATTGMNHLIINAQDKSTAHNKSSEAIDLTYDPTATDKTGPVLTKVSGPAKGLKINDPNVTLVYSATDPSGVDTISWTLNESSSTALVADASGQYTIKAVLTTSHANKFVITASDKSANHNKSFDTISVDYNRPPVITGSADTTIVELSTIQFTVTATDPDKDAVKLWLQSTPPAGATFDATTGIFKWVTVSGQTGANTFTFKATDGLDTTVKSIVITISNMPAPKITADPTDQAKCIGSPASFSVTATGTGTLSYQWKNAAGNLTEGHFAGTKTNALSITTITAADAGTYTCVVSTAGGSTASSKSAALTVNAVTSITTQPSPQALCLGAKATFTVAATGTAPLSYQWQIGGVNIATAPNAVTYSIASVAASDVGNYSCIVMGGCGSVTSATAGLSINKYTVTFDANGGGAVAAQSISCGSTAAVPAVPSAPAGNNFGGWYLGTTATAFDFTTPITAAITLKAKWNLNQVTVTFDKNTGTTEASPASQTVSYGLTVALPTTNPQKAGYTFNNWNTKADGSGPAFTAATVVTTSIPVYAQWKINTYKITSSAGAGGTITPLGDVSVNSGDNATFNITPNVGYDIATVVVDGVADAAAKSAKQKVFTNVTATHTITATFAVTYEISFDSQGAGALPTQWLISGSHVIEPTAVSRSGYFFKGWYNGSTKWDFANNTVSGKMSLKALWDIKDKDGNVYNEVNIGGVIWMKENLQTKTLNNGTAINRNSIDDWVNNTSFSSCFDNGDYGQLYNVYAISSGQLAPDGWHVATQGDWYSLLNYYATNDLANTWIDGGSPGTNATGFTALPGGKIDEAGNIANANGSEGYWWKGDGTSVAEIYYYRISMYYNLNVSNLNGYGYSVRCVRNY